MKRYELTTEDRAQFAPWRDKWIANAMSTKQIDDVDKQAMESAINGLYEAANLPRPKHIIFVPSPFVMCYAGGLSAAILWLRNNGKPTRAATSAATSAATIDATRAATSDATIDATRAATIDATIDATRAATRAATSAATIDATSAATIDATRAATSAATIDATIDATSDATSDATIDATIDATRAATIDATRAATRAATIDATSDATSDATIDATIDATRAATSDEQSNWYVTLSPGEIGVLSKNFLAPEYSLFALECIKNVSYWNMWDGGNQWSGWVAYLSFFKDVCKLDLPIYEKFKHYEAAAIHGGPRVMHPDFCIVSDRPEVLKVDEQNRPHCDDGPFCRWRDGSALYSVHGVRVPAWMIEHPDQITVGKIEAEQNAEVRRVMIERYGQERYLLDSKAEEIHRDDFGVLYRKDIPGDEALVMVKVVNSTPEPDGTFKDYFLRVPPAIVRAKQAVAWTFGMEESQYEPTLQT
jgi:hypothetical protein